MVERIVFRGMTASDVEKLSEKDFNSMINSRERRFLKRNFLRYKALVQKVKGAKDPEKPIRTHVREAVILPEWINRKFMVHNGKDFQIVSITAGMVGHRLGDFAFTTKRVQHSAPGIRATKGSKAIGEK